MQNVSITTLADSEGGWPRVVISDLHLGSPHCRTADLMTFLELLPADALLILNGDTIDSPGQALPPAHQAVLDCLERLAMQDRLLWIYGNHDDGHMPIRAGKWPPTTICELKGRLLITHGDSFDNVMPRYEWFLKIFRSLHRLRMRLGAKPVHVARYAKFLKPLYDFLCRTVKANALEHAQERGAVAITCGHVHQYTDDRGDSVRYLNSGCWTEEQATCIIVSREDLKLVQVDAILAAGTWPA